jgi:hypothetical protein
MTRKRYATTYGMLWRHDNVRPWAGFGVVYVTRVSADRKTSGRRFDRLARPLAVALLVFSGTFSAPAVACLCSCSIFSSPGRGSTAAEVNSADYRQVFSGLVISTERIDEPVAATVVSTEKFVEDPGYWVRSRILVLRIWRGTPSTVAEVWTPVHTNCDWPPIVGSYFSALVRTERGRRVASNSPCDCALKATATEGPGLFAVAGLAITTSALGAIAIALLVLVKVMGRRSPSG